MWKHYYSVGGNNLQLAIQQSKESVPENINAEAQCKILLAAHIYECSMIWGDIPFTEAWKADIKYPHFDTQEVVLNGVIDMLDEAIGMIDPSDKNCIDEYDPYYKGNMNKWIAFAKSLKFRTLIIMADADPTKATDIKAMIEAGGMISSANDNMEFMYSENAGNENPKYGINAKYTNGLNMMFFASNYMMEPMKKYDDARIPVYFDQGTDGEYRGLNNRQVAELDDNGDFLSSVIGSYLYRKDCPDLIFSYQEQLLFEAEVYARGLGVVQDLAKANSLFQDGVKAACDYYKADAFKTATFLANLPDLSTLPADKALEEIHIQQWIDLMDRPIEELVQWRRSGNIGNEVPQLEVPVEATAKDLFRRWTYPDDEVNGNINAPKESPKIWEAIWIDK